MSKVSAADTGYPGAPSTGVGATVPSRTTPSTTGWPGLTATPCTASVPAAETTVGGVVVPPRARAGDHDDQVGAGRRVAHRVHDPLRLVRNDS